MFYSSGAPQSEAENVARTYDKKDLSELLAAGVFKKKTGQTIGGGIGLLLKVYSRVLAEKPTGTAWVVCPTIAGESQGSGSSPEMKKNVWTKQELPAPARKSKDQSNSFG